MMLSRVLEPEVMDTEDEARDYDAMDHAEVNRRFVDDLVAAAAPLSGELLDLGTGTALIPVLLCRRVAGVRVLAIDLAQHMLALGRRNVSQAGLGDRIVLERLDAKELPQQDGHFAGVVSNSIVHHIPDPSVALAEAVRVTAPGGFLFVRDLLRPRDDAEVARLVGQYAADANDRQRKLFDDSLRAALSLAEIQALVSRLGFAAGDVCQTSDRHWTWFSRKA